MLPFTNCDICSIVQSMEKKHAINRYKIQIFLPLHLPTKLSMKFSCAVSHSALSPLLTDCPIPGCIYHQHWQSSWPT